MSGIPRRSAFPFMTREASIILSTFRETACSKLLKVRFQALWKDKRSLTQHCEALDTMGSKAISDFARPNTISGHDGEGRRKWKTFILPGKCLSRCLAAFLPQVPNHPPRQKAARVIGISHYECHCSPLDWLSKYFDRRILFYRLFLLHVLIY